MRAIAAFLLLSVAARAGEGGRDLHDWNAARTHPGRHFVVETNTFDEIARSLVLHLDTSYERLEERFGPLPDGRDGPMRFLLFRSRKGYYDRGGGVRGALGHFDAALDRSALIWDGCVGDEGWPIAVHESCHHYFRRRFPGVVPPTWYTEGLACYFEGMLDLSAPHGVARLRLETARGAVVRGGARLEKVLLARADLSGGRLQLAGFTPTRFYALAWSFVHYLESDCRLRKGLRRFEKRYVAAKAAPRERERLAMAILAEECGDIAELEAGWRKHVEELPHHARPAKPAVGRAELQAGSAYSRYRALRRLHHRRFPEELRPDVLERLGDPDVLVRAAALRLLSRSKRADTVPALLGCLDFGDPELRRDALRALAHSDAVVAVPRLLDERDKGDRDLVVRALAAIGTPETWPALREAVMDNSLSDATRARCARPLGWDRLARRPLLVASESSGETLRTAVRIALHRIDLLQTREAAGGEGDGLGSITLTAALKDDPRLKVLAARYLESKNTHFDGAGAAPTPVQLLLSLVRSAETTEADRAAACRLLGERRALEAVPDLRRLCRPEQADTVRLQAVRALIEITGETRGFVAGQSARDREAAYRAWQQ